MINGAIEANQKSQVARRALAKQRQQRVLALHSAGMGVVEIADRLNISRRTVHRDMTEMAVAIVESQQILEDAGIDAEDAWQTLTKMHDADLADIVENPDAPITQLRYKPIAQWPDIWRRGLAGQVQITPVSIPDGERTPGGDEVRYKVEIKRESLLKILELAGKLQSVDAFVKQQAGDVNVLVVTAEQQRVSRLERAKQRLAVRDVTPRDVMP